MGGGNDLLSRITLEAGKCGGRHAFAANAMRVTDILELLAADARMRKFLRDYAFLEREDILARDQLRRPSGRSRRAHSMRFLIDQSTPIALAAHLRGRGHEWAHVIDLGLDEAGDAGAFGRTAVGGQCTREQGR